MSGIDAACAIRAFEAERHLPPAKIILVTGDMDLKAKELAKSCKIDRFIMKPVRRATFIDAILSRNQ